MSMLGAIMSPWQEGTSIQAPETGERGLENSRTSAYTSAYEDGGPPSYDSNTESIESFTPVRRKQQYQ